MTSSAGHQRIDALRIAAEGLDGIAHCAQIDDGGDAGKVLHQHARRHVGNLAAGLGFGLPFGQELDVAGGHVDAILAAQQVFEQYFQAEGQAAQVEAALTQGGQAIDGVAAIAGIQRGTAGKIVHRESLSIRATRMDTQDSLRNLRPAEVSLAADAEHPACAKKDFNGIDEQNHNYRALKGRVQGVDFLRKSTLYLCGLA